MCYWPVRYHTRSRQLRVQLNRNRCCLLFRVLGLHRYTLALVSLWASWLTLHLLCWNCRSLPCRLTCICGFVGRYLSGICCLCTEKGTETTPRLSGRRRLRRFCSRTYQRPFWIHLFSSRGAHQFYNYRTVWMSRLRGPPFAQESAPS